MLFSQFYLLLAATAALLAQGALFPFILPLVAAAECPSLPTSCYSDFALLKHDMESVGRNQQEVFTVCPNSTLTVDGSPLGIQLKGVGSKYQIQCGFDGNRRNQCVMQGGSRHFSPGDSQLQAGVDELLRVNLTIQGMSFRGATNTSFFAQLTSAGTFHFEDCLWEENTSSDYQQAGALHFAHHVIGNQVTFSNCYFLKNKGDPGAIYYDGYALGVQDFAINHCVFLENESKEWAATIHYPSLSLTNSCFVGNSAKNDGALVNVGKNLAKNGGNYARNNTVGTVPPWSTCAVCGPVCHDGVYQQGHSVGFEDDICHRFENDNDAVSTCIPEPCLSDNPPCTDIATVQPVFGTATVALGRAAQHDCNETVTFVDVYCTGEPGLCQWYSATQEECEQVHGCSWLVGETEGSLSTDGCVGVPWACWKFDGDKTGCNSQGTCVWNVDESSAFRSKTTSAGLYNFVVLDLASLFFGVLNLSF